MGIKIDVTGKRFGRLTAVKCVGVNRYRNRIWECRCDCGNTTTVIYSYLKNGSTQSCGCLRKEVVGKKSRKHNLRGNKLYVVWYGMKRRCYYKNAINYKNYGGRGITVCDEWRNDFQAFYDWAMSNGYKEEVLENGKNFLTLERIDYNGNYEPLNCCWVSQAEQANNKRNNHLITYKGETKTLKQWSEETGISYRCLVQRINRLKWDVGRALSTQKKEL